jgi:5'-nucleotidase
VLDRTAAVARILASHFGAEAPRLLRLDAGGRGSRPAFFRALGRTMRASPNEARSWFELRIVQEIRPFADVPQFLAHIPSGIQPVILTNGRSLIQRAKLQHAGLMPFFDSVYISEEMGVAKPNRAAFCRALAGTPAQEACMIGDSYELDIHPASNLGMTTFQRLPSIDHPSPVAPSQRLASLETVWDRWP